MADAESRAEATHATIARSAAKQVSAADRNTELAVDRTILAAERTYAAWVRTGLSSLAAGVGARALLKGVVTEWLSLATAELLVLFSAFCFLAAVWREMFPADWSPSPEIRRLPAPLLIGVNGFLVLVSLAAVIGVATAH